MTSPPSLRHLRATSPAHLSTHLAVTSRQARRRLLESTAAGQPAVSGFEEWLWRHTTIAVDTEVNVQLGEYTVRKNQITLLDGAVPRDPDFIDACSDVFGDLSGREQRRLHCAELSVTQHRQYVRLVGTDRDVQRWSAPQPEDGPGTTAGAKWPLPCLTTPPRRPAGWLLGLRPLLRTPERRLSR